MNIPAEFRRESPFDRRISGHRFRRAIRILSSVALLLAAANGLMLFYAFTPATTSAPVAGLTCGSILSSAVLIIAIWRRQIWARYILICVIWACFLAFCVPLLQELGQGQSWRTRPPQLLTGALLCYAAANVLLIRSRSVRKMISPGASRILRD